MRTEGRTGQTQTRLTLHPGGGVRAAWGFLGELSGVNEIYRLVEVCHLLFNSTPSVLFSNGPAPSVCVLSQLCPTLCDPRNCSPPGSSVRRIFQARILEWVAISSPRRSSWPRDWTCLSYFSCIGRQILDHWATWEAFWVLSCYSVSDSVQPYRL